MTAELDTTRLVRAWLQEGVTVLPDRVLDAALDEAPRTRQPRRHRMVTLSAVPQPARLDLPAAVLLLVLALGAGLIGGGTVWRSTPIVRELPGDAQPLPPGRYAIGQPFPVRFGIDIPANWQNDEFGSDVLGLRPTEAGGTSEL